MKDKELKHDIERVVTRVLPHAPKDKVVAKSEFEVVLTEILRCLHENTQIGIDTIAKKTSKVRVVLLCGDDPGDLVLETRLIAQAADHLIAPVKKPHRPGLATSRLDDAGRAMAPEPGCKSIGPPVARSAGQPS